MAEFLSARLGDDDCPLDAIPTGEAGDRVADAIHRATATDAAERRASPRVRYDRVATLQLQAFDLKHQATGFHVKPRNVSDVGLSFLHDHALAKGTPCRVTLVSRRGNEHPIDGRVTRSVNVLGQVHEVAIQFDTPIDAFGMLEGQ